MSGNHWSEEYKPETPHDLEPGNKQKKGGGAETKESFHTQTPRPGLRLSKLLVSQQVDDSVIYTKGTMLGMNSQHKPGAYGINRGKNANSQLEPKVTVSEDTQV